MLLLRRSPPRSADGLAAVVEAVLPGPGSALDRASLAARDAVGDLTSGPVASAVARALHGNGWLGHPLHPVLVTVPIGAFVLAGWHDLRAASGDRAAEAEGTAEEPLHDERAATAIRVGLVAALIAAATGVVQFLDARGEARREATLHGSMNVLALVLYVASLLARRRGWARRGRRLATAGLAVVGVSGYLGGDVAYRHGVGMRPSAHVPAGEHRTR